MDLATIFANIADQDRGRELIIVDPWTGVETGMRFVIAGPDSQVQNRARLAMMDELADAARADGTVTAEARETARLNCLARCLLGWTVEFDGQSLPFEHGNVVRVLRAGSWIQAQVDSFAADRAKFRSGAA